MKSKSIRKKFFAFATALLVAATSFMSAQATPVYAALNSMTEQQDDPEYGRANGYIEDGFFDENQDGSNNVYSTSTSSAYTGGGYVHNSRFDGYPIVNGIDVSKYQGNINWSAVKAAGIDFAFVRVGYRGASSGTLNSDAYYLQNLQNAAAAGVRVGVYIYSQAISTAEAVEEANYVIGLIAGYNISMPVVIDYEYDSYHTGRLYKANLSRQTATDVCNAFCARVESAGYTGMVYANKNMLQESMNASGISYPVWLANYTSQTTYGGNYVCWQYSSSGRVSGINGRVDCNYWYGDLSGVYTGSYGGVDYTSVFDPEDYAKYNPDVAAACGNSKQALLTHFVTYGMQEGRRAKVDFCVRAYRDRYQDLQSAFGTDWKKYYLHYIESGKKEGRDASVTAAYAITGYGGVDYSSVYNYGDYTSMNPDVASAFKGDDYTVLQHFISFGMNEGRQASVSFNVRAYMAQNRDLRQAFGEDLKQYYLHYIQFGKAEGRKATGSTEITDGITNYNGVDYSAVYNYQYYIKQNPDIAAAYPNDDVKTLEHFVVFGMREGRQASENFNVAAYRAKYTDLRQAFGEDLEKYYQHYMQFGKAEGRQATGSTEITDGITIYNGVDYSAVYNYQYYIKQNPDVAAAYQSDDYAALEHFVTFGMSEGRMANSEFNVAIYQSNYPDLQAAFGGNLAAYYEHYMRCGKAEGRVANILLDTVKKGLEDTEEEETTEQNLAVEAEQEDVTETVEESGTTEENVKCTLVNDVTPSF